MIPRRVPLPARHTIINRVPRSPRLRRRAQALLPLSTQQAHDVVEGLLDINAVLRGGLDELAAQLAGERVTLLRRDFALRHAVGLVAYEHDGDGAGGAGGRGERAGV